VGCGGVDLGGWYRVVRDRMGRGEMWWGGFGWIMDGTGGGDIRLASGDLTYHNAIIIQSREVIHNEMLNPSTSVS